MNILSMKLRSRFKDNGISDRLTGYTFTVFLVIRDIISFNVCFWLQGISYRSMCVFGYKGYHIVQCVFLVTRDIISFNVCFWLQGISYRSMCVFGYKGYHTVQCVFLVTRDIISFNVCLYKATKAMT